MRGLKQETEYRSNHQGPVASFTDAWIETGLYVSVIKRGGRIFYRCVDWNYNPTLTTLTNISRIFYRCVDWNVKILTIFYPTTKSHLLQMRGLKLRLSKRFCIGSSRIFYRCVDWNHSLSNRINYDIVASFTDAWIETDKYPFAGTGNVSHLLQMRGLKQG